VKIRREKGFAERGACCGRSCWRRGLAERVRLARGGGTRREETGYISITVVDNMQVEK
jgi:hypothetical protein